MPVEIRELVIKATVAIDWENKAVTETGDDIVCLRLPNEKAIANYVSQYFKQERVKTLCLINQHLPLSWLNGKLLY